MPTTMPANATLFNSAFLATIIAAAIGACIPVLLSWRRMRHESRQVTLQEMERLRWTKRWEAIEETYSHLVKTFIAVRRMLFPQGKEQSQEERQAAWTTCNELRMSYLQRSVFLPKKFDARIREIDDEFRNITSDLSQYSTALFSGPMSGDDHKFYRSYRIKHEKSLCGGDMQNKLDQLKDDLRDYLNEGEPS